VAATPAVLNFPAFAPAEIARHGFKVPRARSEPFPKAAESGRKIKFLMVNGGFAPYQHLVSI